MSKTFIPISSNPNAEKQKLFSLYKKEPVLHQKILQLKALLYSSEGKGDFLNGITCSSLRTKDHKKFNALTLNVILDELVSKKLLTKEFSCTPLILHDIVADVIHRQCHDAVEVSELSHFSDYVSHYEFGKAYTKPGQRFIHVAVHKNNPSVFLEEKNAHPESGRYLLNGVTTIFYEHHLDPVWLESRHPIIQLYLLCIKLSGFYSLIKKFPSDLAYWLAFIQKNDVIQQAITHQLDKNTVFMSRLVQLCFFFKPVAYIESFINRLPDLYYYTYEAKGLHAFFYGNINPAPYYEKAIKLVKSVADKKEWFVDNTNPLFYALSLLKQANSPSELKKASSVASSLKKANPYETLGAVLEVLIYLKANDRTAAMSIYRHLQYTLSYSTNVCPLIAAMLSWADVLLEPEELPKQVAQYQEIVRLCQSLSYAVVAQLYAELIQLDIEDHPIDHLGAFKFMDILQVKQPWEYAMEQLQSLVTDKSLSSEQTILPLSDKRMVWAINPASQHIEAIEQSFQKNGRWSAGRAIALKRLYNQDPKLDYLTTQDWQVVKAGLDYDTYGWYRQENYSWDTRETFNRLVGHPLLFHGDNRDIPLELVKGKLALQVEKANKGYHLTLSHRNHSPCIFLEKETSNRYRVIDFSEEAVSIANILPEKGIIIPLKAKDKIIDMLCHAKNSIHIQSDVIDDDLPTVLGDTTPHAHLFPVQEGIRINLWIRPFGESGPYCRAAQGQKSLMRTITTPTAEERKKVVRQFEEEKNNIDSLIQQCEMLSAFDQQSDEWLFENVENSLEALLELEAYQQKVPFVIEWPKGQTLAVKKTVSSNNLSLSIKGSQYWFEYEGAVDIDEEQALDIKQLLDLLGDSQGRFVRLKSGEFLALTEKFKKQLEELKTLSDGNKIYHLSTSGLKGLAEEAGTLHEDKAWKSHIKKLAAMEKHEPTIPSTLQAELRDYQIEGFSYLSRLAHWEIGACLADDMGLGKTLQAIALLLSHAPSGPCLVVAPTSVCFVWIEELAKFAPTLQPHVLYQSSDRQALIESLNKMDVLICSYGLLHQAGDLLIKKSWKMVILDEAQAIKNPQTKRWKYATQLNSPCRIALTGTPIENHLGELWSIFRFLNPGLLGSLAHFQQRFSNPIEKNQDPVAKRSLKNVVSPYILRRTKSEVLQELPPKIEQSIFIEPSTEEMAFYEAIRSKALERIHQLNESETNTKRFSILAEISRLRQACCHASLVDENLSIESSKVKEFLILIKNIIDNRHKALVFSQFVRYLDNIKEVLNQENIQYQYLDGSTPVKDRQRAVDAFQAGESDLFLISLKAGGSGLNLTAADYVIILDPWWNPAVEEQAAARAHRMGQLRPVTVYRLIMKNSIEEKILALHKSKKDLASDLLSGGDMNGKISEEELVGLIAG